MTNLDQFESVFKSSDKAVYQYAMPKFRHVLLVTDLDAEHISRFAKQVRTYLSVVNRIMLSINFCIRASTIEMKKLRLAMTLYLFEGYEH